MHKTARGGDPPKVREAEATILSGFPGAISAIESICACLMIGTAFHEEGARLLLDGEQLGCPNYDFAFYSVASATSVVIMEQPQEAPFVQRALRYASVLLTTRASNQASKLASIILSGQVR